MTDAAPLARRVRTLVKANRWSEAMDCFLQASPAEQADPAASFAFVKHALRMGHVQLALDWLRTIPRGFAELRLADLEAECHTRLRNWKAALPPAEAAMRLSPDDPGRCARYVRALAYGAEPGFAISEFFRLAPKFAEVPEVGTIRGEIARGFARRQCFEHARAVLLWGCRGGRADYVGRLLPTLTRTGVGTEALALVREAFEIGLHLDAPTCENIGNQLVEFGELDDFARLIERAPDPVSRALLEAQRRYALDGSWPDAARTARLVEADVAHRFVPAAAAAAGLGLAAKPERLEQFRAAHELMEAHEASSEKVTAILADPSSSLAVVGDAPLGLGTGHGPEIDGHDVVLRFNKVSMRGTVSRDVGAKTTLLLQGVTEWGHGYPEHNPGCLFLLKESFASVSEHWPRVLDCRVPISRVASWPRDGRAELNRLCDRSPTSGLLAIWTLWRLRRLKNVSTFGLDVVSHFEDGLGRTPRFGDTAPAEHGWLRERIFYDALLAAREAT